MSVAISKKNKYDGWLIFHYPLPLLPDYLTYVPATLQHLHIQLSSRYLHQVVHPYLCIVGALSNLHSKQTIKNGQIFLCEKIFAFFSKYLEPLRILIKIASLKPFTSKKEHY